MTAMSIRMAAALLAVGVLALSVTPFTDLRAAAPAVDPVAVKTLQRMTDYTSKLQQFSVHTESTLEDCSTPASGSISTSRPAWLYAGPTRSMPDAWAKWSIRSFTTTERH